MPHAKSTGPGNRSRSMILQPEDIVPQTAAEAIADIKSAVHAVVGSNQDGSKPRNDTIPHEPWTGRRAGSNMGTGKATIHEGEEQTGDNETDGQAERKR